MKFSKMVDYKGRAHYVCKTGRKNIRILEPGNEYSQSFVVPMNQVSNRRPADFTPDSDAAAEPLEELDDMELIPQ